MVSAQELEVLGRVLVATGVNAKALSTFMGHANISITLDRYGHLMPGSEEEAARLLDAYMTAQRKRADERARGARQELTGVRTGERVGERSWRWLAYAGLARCRRDVPHIGAAFACDVLRDFTIADPDGFGIRSR
jgi:hypothetical protein